MSHRLYMRIAQDYAKEKSKCQFTKVGCVVVNENDRIIATGVNGTISGMVNCEDVHMPREDHAQFTEEHEIHAEENAILELARSSVTFNKITVYTTLSPCKVCLKHLLGLILLKADRSIIIDKIVYGEKYHRLSDEELQGMKARAKSLGVFLGSVEEAVKFDLLEKVKK